MTLADDLLAAFQSYAIHDVVALGHSFGGIASLLALIQQPQHFRALILLDPTILTPQILDMMRQARTQGLMAQHPLAQGAARRRRSFESIEEAYERFRARPLFADWDDEALRLYAEYGTQPAADGTRTLTWLPEWEAYYFSSAYTEIWEELPKLNQIDVPILIIGGGDSDTFIPETAAKVREMLPRATHISIPGHGHLFPQSAPLQTAQIIADWLATK
jgi:pimeloyl-ACP methyl ester carboxylesterase